MCSLGENLGSTLFKKAIMPPAFSSYFPTKNMKIKKITS